MNCEEYLRKLHENPLASEPAMGEHARDCKSCRQQRNELLMLEKRIQDSLKMDVDSELMASVRNVPIQRTWYKPILIAATLVVLVAGALIGSLGQFAKDINLATDLPVLVAAHIEAEPAALQSRGTVEKGAVAILLNNLGAVLTREIEDVVYAAPCLIRDQPGLHMVLREDDRVVSVLLMPGEYLAAEQAVNHGSYTGRILPTKYGSLAVVSDDAGVVDIVMHRIVDAVMWGS